MIHDGGGGALPVTGLYCIARPVLHSTSTALPVPAKTGISHGLWADFEDCFRLFQLFLGFLTDAVQHSLGGKSVAPCNTYTLPLCDDSVGTKRMAARYYTFPLLPAYSLTHWLFKTTTVQVNKFERFSVHTDKLEQR